MIIEGKEFIPAPDGVHEAVCVDVVDLGVIPGTFGPKDTLKLVWEIAAKMDDGRRFIVQKRYTKSLSDKSNLAGDLKTWRGRAFTADEKKAFDTEKLIGAACQLVIVHAEKEGQIYANVKTVIKPANKLAPSGTYVRVKDRPGYQPPKSQVGSNGSAGAHAEHSEADEIPF